MGLKIVKFRKQKAPVRPGLGGLVVRIDCIRVLFTIKNIFTIKFDVDIFVFLTKFLYQGFSIRVARSTAFNCCDTSKVTHIAGVIFDIT